jgi:hypothetical protein
MTAALQGLVNKLDLRGQTMGDVALGAVIKHSRDWNLARESVIDSGLTLRTPGMDLQRACGTSIEAAILIANKIALGQIDCGIAGGLASCLAGDDPPQQFAAEPLKQGGIHQVGMNHLERDGKVERRVVRRMDRCHPAVSQRSHVDETHVAVLAQ